MSEKPSNFERHRAALYARLVVDLAEALGVSPPALDDPQGGADLVARVRDLATMAGLRRRGGALPADAVDHKPWCGYVRDGAGCSCGRV